MNQGLGIGAIVLAAGASCRMGQTKQVLPYRGTTLVGYASEQAQQAGLDPVVVVTGAQADVVTKALPDTVHPVHNSAWSQGMGSSLVCGINALVGLRSDLDAVMVTLADQPRVDADLLRQYVRAWQDHSCDAVALRYPSGPGVPALLATHLLTQLDHLRSQGAKAVLRAPDRVVRVIDQPEASFDVDTYDAYRQLLGHEATNP